MTETSAESYAALERKLEACSAELGEAHACQDAISDVLRAISASRGELQPVFDTIAERARVLCKAEFGAVSQFDGELVHLMAFHGASAEGEAALRAHFPMVPGPETVTAQAVLERAPCMNPDVTDDPRYTPSDFWNGRRA